MKKVFFILLIILFSKLSAQTGIDTLEFIKNETQSLINSVVSDSLYFEAKYLLRKYDAVVTISSEEIKIRKIKKCFHKTIYDTVRTRVDYPFDDLNTSFYDRQITDTSNKLIPEIVTEKSIINEIDNSKYPILIIDKPIFSSDLKSVYIRTSIKYGGGCIGYESYYQLVDQKWIKISTSIVYRC